MLEKKNRSNMVATQANRARFISSLMAFMAQYGFQGADIDWEWPVDPARGGRPGDTAGLVALVKEMRAAFGTRYGISIAIPPDYAALRYFDLKAMEPSLDFIGFMSYGEFFFFSSCPSLFPILLLWSAQRLTRHQQRPPHSLGPLGRRQIPHQPVRHRRARQAALVRGPQPVQDQPRPGLVRPRLHGPQPGVLSARRPPRLSVLGPQQGRPLHRQSGRHVSQRGEPSDIGKGAAACDPGRRDRQGCHV